MRERSFTLLVVVITALLLVLAFSMTAEGASEKVQLCHATGSESNPYVLIEVAPTAVENAHVDRETGNLHGDSLGNQDFIVTDDQPCPPTADPTPPSTEPCEDEDYRNGNLEECEQTPDPEPPVTPVPPIIDDTTTTSTTLPTVVTSQPTTTTTPTKLPYTGTNENLVVLAIGLLALGSTLVLAGKGQE
jgi:LPXTG-motif cell wall-anchored protein